MIELQAERDGACIVYDGPEKAFQHKAALAIYVEEGRTVPPWAWINATCGPATCLNTQHLKIAAQRILNYPQWVCVYCGRDATTRDHLLPVSMTGRAARQFVATVPSCAECNSFIGDRGSASITTRRRLAHKAIARRYAKNLRTLDWSEEDLAELGPMLRTHTIGAMAKKVLVRERLEWPTDPAYDLRALESSGIEDPYATGLLGEDPLVIFPRQRRAS